MNMNCDCKDWLDSWHQIESAQVMASIHGQQYTGAKFKFCPWCNKELQEEKKCEHCFCKKDSLQVLHCCKCNEPIKYEYKPYEWKTGLPDYEWRTVSTSHGTNPCSNCQMNPAVNKFASGVCHCALPAMNRW